MTLELLFSSMVTTLGSEAQRQMSRFIYNVYVYRSCILILHENNQSIGFITHIWVCLQKESCCISSVRVCLKWQSDMLSPLPLPVQCAAVAGLQGAGPDRSGMQCGFLSVIRAYKNTHTLMSPSVPAACITGNRVSLKRMADYSESRPTDLMVLEQIYTRLQAWPFQMATPSSCLDLPDKPRFSHVMVSLRP